MVTLDLPRRRVNAGEDSSGALEPLARAGLARFRDASRLGRRGATSPSRMSAIRQAIPT
jgi:hypothetical protein